MSTEVGVPGKTIHYLNLHKEGTSEGTFCEVDENWNGKILDKQDDYLVAISRFEVPMNRVAINREIKNAVEIYRYLDEPLHAAFQALSAEEEKNEDVIQLDKLENNDEVAKAGVRLRVPDHLSFRQRYTYDQSMARDGSVDLTTAFEAHAIRKTKSGDAWYNNPEVMIGLQKRFAEDNNGYFSTDSAGGKTSKLSEEQYINDELAHIVSSDEMDAYLTNTEQLDVLNMTKLNPINLPPCHTIFEMLSHLNNSIRERLLLVDSRFGNDLKHYNTIQALSNDHGIGRNSDATDTNPFRYNTFGAGNVDDFDDSSFTPIANFYIKMSGDYKFSVVMNLAFAQSYYIKLHPELFRMFQFREVNVSDLNADGFFLEGNQRKMRYDRSHLRGRRFMGDRLAGASRENMAAMMGRNRATHNEYRRSVRVIDILENKDAGQGTISNHNQQNPSVIESKLRNIVMPRTVYMAEMEKFFTAPVSASDSATRVKSIVFQSSLPTRSESSSGSTYQHFLTDFTLPTASSFSFNTNSLTTDTVTENMAQEVSYFSSNPSSGRLLMLTDPSPLYEIKLKVLAKCWNFEHEHFYFESIPLPPGATFTCKLVFVSKNEIHDRTQRDRLQGGT